MSYELALLAGLPQAEAELLRAAAPMHDLGKVGIPDAILNKPGKYTDEEYAVMKRHADIGYRILAKSERPILKAAAIIAHEHHERWDGTGYPRRLERRGHPHLRAHRGAGRLLRRRDQRPRLPQGHAAGEGAGHHPGRARPAFRTRLVDLLLENLDRFLAISEALKDGEHDIVAAMDLIRPMPVPVEPELVTTP